MYLAPRQPGAKSRNVDRGFVIGKAVHKCEAGLHRVSMGRDTCITYQCGFAIRSTIRRNFVIVCIDIEVSPRLSIFWSI